MIFYMRPTSVANDEGVVHQLPFIVPKRWGKVDKWHG